jgi:hypothetical protein
MKLAKSAACTHSIRTRGAFCGRRRSSIDVHRQCASWRFCQFFIASQQVLRQKGAVG